MKKIILISSILLQFISLSLVFGQCDCNALLSIGIFNTYEIRNERAVESTFRYFSTHSKQEVQNYVSRQRGSATVSVPLLEGLLDLGAKYSGDIEKFNSLKQKSRVNINYRFNETDKTWIMSRIASPDLLRAWESCVRQCNPVGLKARIDGDPAGEFTYTISWVPSVRGEPKSTIISNVAFAGVQRTGNNNLKKGARIENYSGLTQSFKKMGTSTSSISISFATMPPITTPIEAGTLTTEPTSIPVYEDRWFDRDERGNWYSETFTVNAGDAPTLLRRRVKGNDGYFADGSFAISDNQGEIYRVDYNCTGSGCGWSYNPRVGQYSGCYDIINNAKAFKWFRKWTGPPCVETYTAYYKKPRQVCIKNCQ